MLGKTIDIVTLFGKSEGAKPNAPSSLCLIPYFQLFFISCMAEV
jgi:hypothetical protein